jgi:hypothetical protein
MKETKLVNPNPVGVNRAGEGAFSPTPNEAAQIVDHVRKKIEEELKLMIENQITAGELKDKLKRAVRAALADFNICVDVIYVSDNKPINEEEYLSFTDILIAYKDDVRFMGITINYYTNYDMKIKKLNGIEVKMYNPVPAKQDNIKRVRIDLSDLDPIYFGELPTYEILNLILRNYATKTLATLSLIDQSIEVLEDYENTARRVFSNIAQRVLKEEGIPIHLYTPVDIYDEIVVKVAQELAKITAKDIIVIELYAADEIVTTFVEPIYRLSDEVRRGSN